MAEQRRESEGSSDQPKQPFISQEDRPEVQLKPETPITELRVRDLVTILGAAASKSPFEVGKTPLKDFFEKPFPETTKDFLKEIKPENIEKPPKFEKNEKFEKVEKHEKREIKELKAEKIEVDGVFDPGRIPGPDPRLDQVIQAVSALTRQVNLLANQIEEIQKKLPGSQT